MTDAARPSRPEPGPYRPPFWTMARRDSLVGYLFIAPQMIGITVFVLVPLGWCLVFAARMERAGGHLHLPRDGQLRGASADRRLPGVLTATAVFSAGWSCSTWRWRCCWRSS
jgi:multiple sugar transport system permease protein